MLLDKYESGYLAVFSMHIKGGGITIWSGFFKITPKASRCSAVKLPILFERGKKKAVGKESTETLVPAAFKHVLASQWTAHFSDCHTAIHVHRTERAGVMIGKP